jgi:hypothetical protein
MMMPSSVGSADIAISDSTAPASSSCPDQPLVHAFQHIARAGDGIFRPFDLDAVAARGNIDTPSRFSIRTRLASNWPNSAPRMVGSSNSSSARARVGGGSGADAPHRWARAGLRAMRSFQVRAWMRPESKRPSVARHASAAMRQAVENRSGQGGI